MTDLENLIADNLKRIHQRIHDAAHAADRDPTAVQLVAVTKYVDAATSAAVVAAGCQTLGESRPQQLWDKADQPELARAEWHLIGHLQRNKVARTLSRVALIHSVDSLRLLRAINAAAAEQSRQANILLEVNCSGDEAKHGLTADGLKELLSQLPSCPQVQVQGLMTMAARAGGNLVAAKNFAALRELRDQVQVDCPPQAKLTELSMGMSNDFEVAIREGATLVRIGSLIYAGLK